MEHSRRRFLALLASAAGVAAVGVPTLSFAHVLEPLIAPAEEREFIAGTGDDFTLYCAEVLRQLEQQLAADGPFTVVPLAADARGHKLGESKLAHQFSVGIDLDRHWQNIGAVAAALALRVREVKATEFGLLELPLAVESAVRMASQKSGIAIRGIRCWDIVEGGTVARIDVVVG